MLSVSPLITSSTQLQSLMCMPLRAMNWICWSIDTHANTWGRSWPSATTRLTACFACGLRSDLVFAWKGKNMIIHDTECLCWDQMLLNITHSKLPCNYFCYTHPLICLLCCSVKNDVVIASQTDMFDELCGDTTEDSCELWGYVLMLEYMLQCFGMVMSFGPAANIVLPEAICT